MCAGLCGSHGELRMIHGGFYGTFQCLGPLLPWILNAFFGFYFCSICSLHWVLHAIFHLLLPATQERNVLTTLLDILKKQPWGHAIATLGFCDYIHTHIHIRENCMAWAIESKLGLFEAKSVVQLVWPRAYFDTFAPVAQWHARHASAESAPWLPCVVLLREPECHKAWVDRQDTTV